MDIPVLTIIDTIGEPIRMVERVVWNAMHIWRGKKALGREIKFSRYGSIGGRDACAYLKRFGVMTGVCHTRTHDFLFTVKASQYKYAVGLLLGMGCEVTSAIPARVKPIKPSRSWREGPVSNHPQNAPTGDPRPGMQKPAQAKSVLQADIEQRVKGFFS